MYIDNILSVIQSCHEPYGVYWNYCVYPITRLSYPGSPKVMLLLWLTHSVPVNQSDNLFLFLLILLYSIVPTLLRTNKWYTHTHTHILDNNVQNQWSMHQIMCSLSPWNISHRSATTSEVWNIMNGITIWNDHHECDKHKIRFFG